MAGAEALTLTGVNLNAWKTPRKNFRETRCVRVGGRLSGVAGLEVDRHFPPDICPAEAVPASAETPGQGLRWLEVARPSVLGLASCLRTPPI